MGLLYQSGSRITPLSTTEDYMLTNFNKSRSYATWRNRFYNLVTLNVFAVFVVVPVVLNGWF